MLYKFILSSLRFIQCLYFSGYINAYIETWWVETWFKCPIQYQIHDTITGKTFNAGVDLVFSFSLNGWHIKAKESSLPSNLPWAGWRKDGFMPFLMLFAQSERKTAYSRIWTQVAMFISFLKR